MTNKEFFQALDDLESEKNINKEQFIESLESALTSAYKKVYGEAKSASVVAQVSQGTVPVYIGSLPVHRIQAEGNFVNEAGEILGKHKGITNYTVGQRKGLGIALGKPVFVSAIRPETNEVVIGSNEESLTHKVVANRVNFMAVEDIKEPMRVWGKIRYNHKGAWCTVERTGEDEITAIFDEPVRAVTPGQALVLYDGKYVLGGGTIVGGK